MIAIEGIAMKVRITIEYDPRWSAEDRAKLGWQELLKREELAWTTGDTTLSDIPIAVVQYDVVDDSGPWDVIKHAL